MKLLKHQGYHLLFLTALLTGIYWLLENDPNSTYLEGEFFGKDSQFWLLLAVLSPIVHQIYVLIIWRVELYYKGFSKLFGKNAFTIYKVGFAILLLSRVVTLILLAISNRNSLEINAVGLYGFTLFCLVPALYLFYSVVKYFGIDRAFGLDHFQPEAAREWALVNKGIFKYTNNGMYIFGFFALYIPGILLASKAALLIALFNHIYIWVHFYTTELPDMKEIYGE